MRRSLFLCVFMLWALSSAAWGGDNSGAKDYQVYELGEIVVTADRPAGETIAITTKITPEEFQSTNSDTVAEALTYVPGVVVSTGRKNEPEISIHGFSQRKTLILIDGVPYYETNYGKLDLNQIPTDVVARIDIVKGAPSVLYGPNAEIAVVNVITKKAGEQPTVTATLEAGEKDRFLGSLSAGWKEGIFNGFLNYTRRESECWRMSEDYTPRQGTIVRRPGGTTNAILEDGGFRNNSDYESDSFWAKFGIEPNEKSEYFMNAHYIGSEKGVPPSVDSETVFTTFPQFAGFARFDRYDDWGADLSGREQISESLSLQGKLFYHHHVDEYVSFSDQTYTTPIATSRFQDYVLGGSIISDFRPVPWNRLGTAVHYRKDSHKERDEIELPFDESVSYTGSIALEDECTRIKDLSVTAGLSYDWFEIDKTQPSNRLPGTKDALNPLLGAFYTTSEGTKFFGSVAKKTRFPTLDQLYSSRSGNSELEAEESINYTLGASRTFLDVIRGELAVFHHDISDLISRDAPGVDGRYRNYSEVKMYGAELSLAFFPMEGLLWTLDYTYNYARDRSDGRVTENVTYVPEHKLDTRIEYSLPTKTRFSVNGLYVSPVYSQLPTPQNPTLAERKSDEYFIWNGRISRGIGDYFTVYLAADNILDENYEPESGFPAPGRQVWVGLTARY